MILLIQSSRFKNLDSKGKQVQSLRGKDRGGMNKSWWNRKGRTIIGNTDTESVKRRCFPLGGIFEWSKLPSFYAFVCCHVWELKEFNEIFQALPIISSALRRHHWVFPSKASNLAHHSICSISRRRHRSLCRQWLTAHWRSDFRSRDIAWSDADSWL